MHAGRTSNMHPATDNFPLALIPIANKPLLCYQIEYLQRNNLTDITVVIEKKYQSKISTFFQDYFVDETELDIEIVYLQDEDESANVLLLLKDKINRDMIILQGDVLIDIPLDRLIENHQVSGNSVTALLKELDLTQKSKIQPQKGETFGYDIFGLSSWGENDSQHNILQQRLVFKATNIDSENMDLKLKPSLLRKQGWLKDELLPFLARHQFKTKLQKYIIKSKTEIQNEFEDNDIQEKLEFIMNPSRKMTKDLVKVGVFIDNRADHYFILRHYMISNQEFQKYLRTSQLFKHTKNTQESFFEQYRPQIEENKKNQKPVYDGLPPAVKAVSLDSVVAKDVQIGEGSQISKSIIGSGVIIGKKVKITNCVILNNVEIGNECVLQNTLFLQKAIIGSGSKLKDVKISSHQVIEEKTSQSGDSIE
eukprot:403373180